MTGQHLRETLAKVGLSQAALAKLIGRDAGTVNRWCCDRTSPVPFIVVVLLTAYKMLSDRDRRRLRELTTANE